MIHAAKIKTLTLLASTMAMATLTRGERRMRRLIAGGRHQQALGSA